MSVLARIRQWLARWENAWRSPLDEDEIAIGIEYAPLQDTYQIWVSLSGKKLFWLSGHHTQEGAAAALPRVMAWASRQEQMDPVAYGVEMAYLRDKGDFRAKPPSQAVQAAIRRRIRARDPDIVIVRAAPVLEVPPEEVYPDEETMQLIRATQQVKVVMQLKALSTMNRDPYQRYLIPARQALEEGQLQAAGDLLRQAVGLDPSRPEAFNLLGVLEFLAGHGHAAKKYFRVAIDLDPTYHPAHHNLLYFPNEGGLNLG